MTIPELSMAIANVNTQSDVGTAVLAKTIDTGEAIGDQIVNMIDRSAMERSVNPYVGGNIDLSC